MLPIAALFASLCALAFILATVARAVLIARRRKRRRRWVYVGAEAAAMARRGQEMPVGRRNFRIVGRDVPQGMVEVEPIPPPTAASRGASPEERALLRALGFDPKTHDLRFVQVPHRGVQVTGDGVRVRFFTENQVRGLPGEWKTALRAERTGAVA